MEKYEAFEALVFFAFLLAANTSFLTGAAEVMSSVYLTTWGV
jgi:hypothetical protein